MPKLTPSDAPVAVTGASGYVGSHVVATLVRRGYTVYACLTDLTNPAKTEHLARPNEAGHPGRVEFFAANLLEQGSYDAPFAGCSAVLHPGTATAFGAHGIEDTLRETGQTLIDLGLVEPAPKTGPIRMPR